ncbi:MAG: hypothetical protein R2853_21115 [Thermomicrobiales bacterium]
MPNWDDEINEALAAKAQRRADEQQRRDHEKALKESQQEQMDSFLADVVRPGLEEVKVALTAPGRDRDVEIRDGKDSLSIYVTDPADGYMRSSELYLLFGFEIGKPPATWVRAKTELGVGNGWRRVPDLCGPLDGIDSAKVAKGAMALWLNAVNTGKE